MTVENSSPRLGYRGRSATNLHRQNKGVRHLCLPHCVFSANCLFRRGSSLHSRYTRLAEWFPGHFSWLDSTFYGPLGSELVWACWMDSVSAWQTFSQAPRIHCRHTGGNHSALCCHPLDSLSVVRIRILASQLRCPLVGCSTTNSECWDSGPNCCLGLAAGI